MYRKREHIYILPKVGKVTEVEGTSGTTTEGPSRGRLHKNALRKAQQ
jgi:hypothetical protein